MGDSRAIQGVRDLIRRAAPTDASVLIYGEAGTGKSLMGRTLHQQSSHASGPFVALDLSMDSDWEAALGAADGGTLFLDEIAVLSPAAQGRLLGLVDRPAAGGTRIITATRRSREALRGRGGIGDELFYRLATVEIFAPPLREREGDALLLAEHFFALARSPSRPSAQTTLARCGGFHCRGFMAGRRARAPTGHGALRNLL